MHLHIILISDFLCPLIIFFAQDECVSQLTLLTLIDFILNPSPAHITWPFCALDTIFFGLSILSPLNFCDIVVLWYLSFTTKYCFIVFFLGPFLPALGFWCSQRLILIAEHAIVYILPGCIVISTAIAFFHILIISQLNSSTSC